VLRRQVAEACRRRGLDDQVVDDVVAIFLELRHATISDATRRGLEAARERGVRLGRPPSVSAGFAAELAERWSAGESCPAIAAALEEELVPAPSGERWHARTVARIVCRGLGVEQLPARRRRGAR
jgi:hypothetical protein